MSIKHQMTLYVADRKMNDFMKAFDLRIDCKQFIDLRDVTFTLKPGVVIDEEFFMNFIMKSKELMEGYWIPAILYQGNFFYHPEVKVLSDGQREMFITPKSDVAVNDS